STYAAVARALSMMLRATVDELPPNIHTATPMTPIVIHPSVPECRCVRSVSWLIAPKTLVALARPMSAVSVKMTSPYWNARAVAAGYPMGPSSRGGRLARSGVERHDLHVLGE